jgi:integration host factor subunit beta
MNKSELINIFTEKLEIGEAAASEFVNLFFGSIQQALADGGRVEIRGFGSFELRQYEGYTGRNPKTGIVVDAQPKKLPFFKAGKWLKDFLNQDK